MRQKPQIPTQIVGNAGLYAVCYELTKMGWNVLPTCRNTKGVDVVIYNQSATKNSTVQIKSQQGKNDFATGSSKDVIADFYVFCTEILNIPKYYVLTGKEVRHLIFDTDGKTGVSHWILKKQLNIHENKWGKIGFGYD